MSQHLVPPGFGIVLDPGCRRLDSGRTLVGGSPLTVIRLSSIGAARLDRWTIGATVSEAKADRRLARRLLDAGVAHPRPPPGPLTATDVTVVVPVRDDAEGLARTLAHVGEVGAVVVVDDGSVDPLALRSVIDDAGRSRGQPCTDPHETVAPATPVHLVRRDRPGGPAAARNIGASRVRTPVVAFVDADCAPRAGWIDHLLAHLGDPAAVAVAPRIASAPGAGVRARYEQAASPLDRGHREARVTPRTAVAYVPTACLVMRTAACVEVGGFDEELRFGEDVDLVWRLVAAGGVVRYAPASVVDHRPRPSWSGWARQRIGYGSAAAPLAERHGAAVAPLVAPPVVAMTWIAVGLGWWRLVPLAGVGAFVASWRRLRAARLGAVVSAELAARALMRAGRATATAAVRAWWPVTLPWALWSLRARRALVGCAVVSAAVDRARTRPDVDPIRWTVLHVIDDAAYGLGLWIGAARGRSLRALAPDLGSGARRPRRQRHQKPDQSSTSTVVGRHRFGDPR